MKKNWKQEKISKNGAKSFTNNWLLAVLHTRWKKVRGIREHSGHNCQSFIQEWEMNLTKKQYSWMLSKGNPRNF